LSYWALGFKKSSWIIIYWKVNEIYKVYWDGENKKIKIKK